MIKYITYYCYLSKKRTNNIIIIIIIMRLFFFGKALHAQSSTVHTSAIKISYGKYTNN